MYLFKLGFGSKKTLKLSNPISQELKIGAKSFTLGSRSKKLIQVCKWHSFGGKLLDSNMVKRVFERAPILEKLIHHLEVQFHFNKVNFILSISIQ